MIREVSKHKLSYSVLVFGMLIFIFLFIGAWPNRLMQRIVIASMSIFYFLWGVLTHLKTRDLSKGIAIEYLSVSILAGVLLFLITL